MSQITQIWPPQLHVSSKVERTACVGKGELDFNSWFFSLESHHTHTIARTDALPGVLGGDVSSPRCGEMAQSLWRQTDSVRAASWRAATSKTPVVTHPEDAQAQSVLDVWYYTCVKQQKSKMGTHLIWQIPASFCFFFFFYSKRYIYNIITKKCVVNLKVNAF